MCKIGVCTVRIGGGTCTITPGAAEGDNTPGVFGVVIGGTMGVGAGGTGRGQSRVFFV